jgi:hypothetical protein
VWLPQTRAPYPICRSAVVDLPPPTYRSEEARTPSRRKTKNRRYLTGGRSRCGDRRLFSSIWPGSSNGVRSRFPHKDTEKRRQCELTNDNAQNRRLPARLSRGRDEISEGDDIVLIVAGLAVE